MSTPAVTTSVNSNHQLIDIDFAKTIIRKNFKNLFEQTKKGQKPSVRPIFMHASPGVGKSAILAQLVEELSAELGTPLGFHDFRLASCEASDVNGIPYVSQRGEETETMRFSIPDWFPTDKKSMGILFFDELSNAAISVQHAAYRIIYDRSLHDDVVLPPGWMIVAAGNLKSDKTGVKGIAPALANRFGTHLYIQASVDAFTKYAIQKNFDPRIIGFLNFKQDALYRAPVGGNDEAFPSPRSWESANSYMIPGFSDDEMHILLSGCVGKGTAAEFIGYNAYFGKLPDFNAIMNGKLTDYKVPQNDQGLSFALATSLIICTLQNSEDSKKVGRLHSVLTQMDDEFLIYFFKSIKSQQVNLINIMVETKKSLDKVSQYL